MGRWRDGTGRVLQAWKQVLGKKGPLLGMFPALCQANSSPSLGAHTLQSQPSEPISLCRVTTRGVTAGMGGPEALDLVGLSQGCLLQSKVRPRHRGEAQESEN